MRAVMLTKPTKSSDIQLSECDIPKGKPGWVLVRSKVFGMNHSEQILWKTKIAIPETYFTAWGSLCECLSLQKNDHLLVRGGTCALGYAAIQIAKALGCKVTATTHKESKLPLLTKCGADVSLRDNGSLTGCISGITKALELVGIKTSKDTLLARGQGFLLLPVLPIREGGFINISVILKLITGMRTDLFMKNCMNL